LILVGFESVTAMGGKARNPTKHIPIAVIASLLIQGLVCYLIEYFAANYFLNSGYTMQSAAGSAAPIGDMMIIVGDGLLGHGNGKYFMLGEAITLPHSGVQGHNEGRQLERAVLLDRCHHPLLLVIL
jgi:amino acid transporter